MTAEASRVVWERVHGVGQVLARVPRNAIVFVETSDPQYVAVGHLYRRHGLQAVALVVANALISYRLSLPGEKYWQEFADFFASTETPTTAEMLVAEIRRFLYSSRGNRLVREQKLARLRKAAPVLERLLESPEEYTDLRLLVRSLASVLRARGEEKTIVFAAKMARYLYMHASLETRGGEEIPVPIDRRMALLTSSSGMVAARVQVIMTRLRGDALKAWMTVARESRIPSISLDALVWLPAQGVEKHIRRGIEVARDEYARRLVSYTGGMVKWGLARSIAEQLLYQEPLE